MVEECRLKPTFVIQISFICSRYRAEGEKTTTPILLPLGHWFPFVLIYPLESFYMLWPLGNLDLYVHFSVPNLRFAPFSFNVKTNLGKLTSTEPDSEVDFALIGRFK